MKLFNYFRTALAVSVCTITTFAFTACVGTTQDHPWNACFDGLSNDGETSGQIYVTSGRKAQIIGLQNADFPDLGGHVPGEMGGVWFASFKGADGYWMKLADIRTDEDLILKAEEMIVYPHKTVFDYGSVLDGLKVQSTQFASDKNTAVHISYTIENTSDTMRSINLGFLLNSDLTPVWFSEPNGIKDGLDTVEWNKELECFQAKDNINDWFVVWGSDHKTLSYDSMAEGRITKGNSISTEMYSNITLRKGEKKTVNYVIASSLESNEKAISTYQTMLQDYEEELDEKAASYKDMLSHSELTIPDKTIEEAYYWTRISNRWLEMDVDTIGYFLSAGAVEYPWLFGCDNSYSTQGLLRTGNFELVESTLRLLDKVSTKVNGNGRIIHEMSSNGFVGNKGNTQETSHYIVALWKAFEWTGDDELIRNIYPNVKKSISWLLDVMDTDNNMYPEGYGIMEVKGLNAELIDVAVYTQQALEAAAKMAALVNDNEAIELYSSKAAVLKEKINTEFWDEQHSSYCDFYGSATDAMKTATGAYEQLEDLPKTPTTASSISFYKDLIRNIKENYRPEDKKGWFTNKNWVINTPIETGIAPEDKALRALDNIRANNCGEWGPYLSAIERVHMMTISTGVQAVSEMMYGRIDNALEYISMIARTMGKRMPGAINEMMPDYGCPYQAWTIYGMPVVLVSGCFGIQPDAYNKIVRIEPLFPNGWKEMEIKNVKIGDNEISLALTKDAEHMNFMYSSEEKGWTVELVLPEMNGKQIICNGKEKTSEDVFRFSESSMNLKMVL